MEIVSDAITGRETSVTGNTPYTALVNFYKAFNSQDSELMELNWLLTEEASMSNPLGNVKRGWSEIKQLYEKIFTGNGNVYVEFYDYSIHETKQMFVAVGRERGVLDHGNKEIELSIRTSRTYCLENNSWKQLHHHGSMDNPELLATYQNLLLEK